MKNTSQKILSVIGLFVLLFTFPSQITQAQKSKIGIKGGLNLSSMTFDNADEKNRLPGFNVGVFTHLPITKTFGVQPEVLYSTKGVKAIYNEEFLGMEVAEGESELNLKYLEVPVYFTFNFSKSFDIHLGPYIAVLLNSNAETDTEVLDWMNINESEDIDNDQFNKLDYGLAGGIAYHINNLSLGVNYSYGLNQVASSDEPIETLLGDAKNSNLQVYIGIAF
ncbi:porin family protein [Carboxylicivirga linearis]|uniref:PorT family protein n=1 Tax=Carboxylicivirga linearis TaxID=1628157 RepID=A0ABS5JPD0_9BACT|nr:porin family protein [Carboxylicivirga linearis]MBS2096753.1 PorT family protein [Carboxylicivirga linearis]